MERASGRCPAGRFLDELPRHERARVILFCFFATGRLLVLAFGVRKKSAKTRTSDIDKAIAMKSEFDHQRKANDGN